MFLKMVVLALSCSLWSLCAFMAQPWHHPRRMESVFKDDTGKRSVRDVMCCDRVVWCCSVVHDGGMCVLVLQARDSKQRKPEEEARRPQHAPPKVSYV